MKFIMVVLLIRMGIELLLRWAERKKANELIEAEGEEVQSGCLHPAENKTR
jgi:hypothetical protein